VDVRDVAIGAKALADDARAAAARATNFMVAVLGEDRGTVDL